MKYALKYGLYILLLSLSIWFEQAPTERLSLLLIFSGLLLALNAFRDLRLQIWRFTSYTYLLDLGLIYGMEQFSKYSMNYFLQFFYLLLIVEIALKIRRREWLFLCLLTLFVSGIKVTLLIQSVSGLGPYIQLFFYLVVGLMLVVVLHLTHRLRDEKDANEALYKELFDTHKQLKASLGKQQQLSALNERQRIARELHDALGHEMTALIYQVEVAERQAVEPTFQSAPVFANIKCDARNALQKIRQVVETLREAKMTPQFQELDFMVKRFIEQTGLLVDVKVDPLLGDISAELEATLYRLVQEGLTNVMRHAKAHRVDIHIEGAPDEVRFYFADDGSKVPEYHEGFGLKGMQERVHAHGGHLEIHTEHGFAISATFPKGRPA